MDPTIRRLDAAEASALAAFGEACFREAFREHFAPEAMDALCVQVFALPVMEGLIRTGAWLAGDWQGYVALGETPCPFGGLAPPTAEVARLYVLRRWQRTGTADRLMARAAEEARERKHRSLWLQAFGGNPRALAFYRRWGFRDYGPCGVACAGLLLPHRMMGRDL